MIKSRRLVRQENQISMATVWNDQLAAVRDEEMVRRTPRSTTSWGAEQRRLGSWRSGVGDYRMVGRTAGFVSGHADPRFIQPGVDDDDA